MDPMTLDVIKAISNYGAGIVCLAVLIILHIYNVRVTLPSLAQASRDETQKLVAAFREELAAERRQCHDDNVSIVQAVRDNQSSLIRLEERLKTARNARN